jgi:pimeloyl-ACP methyl ester carboxylesterase
MAVGGVPLLTDLERDFRVIAPDNPGCGLTDKPSSPAAAPVREYMVRFVGELLDELGLPEVSIVGNSTGGYAALAFALSQPHRVRKLVLVGAPPGITEAAPHLLRLLGMRGVNRLLVRTVLKPSLMGTRDLFRYVYVSNVARVPVEYLACAYEARLLPGAQASWLALLEQLVGARGFRRRHLIASELHGIRQPTLFVWGEKDWFAPPSVGRDICGLLPDGRIEVLDDAGHLAWLDQPGDTARLVSTFLS